jgi:hypothetical protein
MEVEVANLSEWSCNVKNKQAVEKLALSLINQWFSSHPSARIQ